MSDSRRTPLEVFALAPVNGEKLLKYGVEHEGFDANAILHSTSGARFSLSVVAASMVSVGIL